MINKKSDILEFVTGNILSFANYYMVVDSLDITEPNVEVDNFYKVKFDMVADDQDNESIVTIKVRKVNITDAIDKKCDVLFDMHFTYLFNETTVEEINMEILNFDNVEDPDIDVFIKDFVNGYMRWILSGIIQLFEEFSLMSHQDTADVFIEFGSLIQLNYMLKVGNNIKMSIKSLFTNNMNIFYEIEHSEELLDLIEEYSEELKTKVVDIIENNNTLVTELFTFDNETYPVALKALQEKHGDLIAEDSETNDDLIKELIYNGIVRSGRCTVSNMLALYDNSEFLRVKSVTYALTYGEREDGVAIETPDEPTDTEDQVEQEDEPTG